MRCGKSIKSAMSKIDRHGKGIAKKDKKNKQDSGCPNCSSNSKHTEINKQSRPKVSVITSVLGQSNHFRLRPLNCKISFLVCINLSLLK